MPLFKTLHKWLSLVVGLQLLIWLGTGLYFNLMDHDKASGNQNRQRAESPAVNLSLLVEPKTVLQGYDNVVSLSQVTLLSHPYYLLTHEKGLYAHFKSQHSMVDAITGNPFVITETIAAAIAMESYKGPARIISTTKLSEPSDDFPKEQNRLWRINIDDRLNTSIYVDAVSGRLIGHSNDDKRFVDFIFMLHFMDYAGEGSFNNVQVIVFAIFTLFFTLTGIIWMVELGLNGQYNPVQLFAGKKRKKVKVFDKHSKNLGPLVMSSHENLLDSLLHHDIALPSTCGGGGTCGRCKIKVDLNIKVTSADRSQLSEQELQSGYRLACQHNSNEVEQLTLADVTEAASYELQLISSEFISPYIKELRFKSVSGERLAFRAGAFMRFFIPAARGNTIPAYLPLELLHHWQDVVYMEYEHLACSRNYSLANGDGQSDELVFIVKIQTSPDEKVKPGIGSTYICNLAPGETIEAVGPFEEFFAQPSSNKPMILIGAGSGMAPLKALIEEQLVKNNSGREIYLYFGARSQIDLIYGTHFQQLSDRFSNFHYLPVLSRPNQGWQGAKGYVQDELAQNLEQLLVGGRPEGIDMKNTVVNARHSVVERKPEIKTVEFYLCGPAPMMESTIELLKSHCVADSAIAFDKFE
ncbi:2Fe-2S iron-sulfur cluster-binding protein [uncultured Shewanella sp.]|uniref:2Fe-2S iron-sulfur cluster-binding protein n=1 Tax=uncultured Shewanella sp. TaxID=173975 RepID=UPI0026182474|nr:2Fe-2S iron-sulfur cluster-binding protein [uncultured Shewanella sp.]